MLDTAFALIEGHPDVGRREKCETVGLNARTTNSGYDQPSVQLFLSSNC